MMAGTTAQTHFVELDDRRRRGVSRALCGVQVTRAEMADRPTCPACVSALECDGKTAEEMFGTEPTNPVRSHYGDPLRDYRPKAE